MDKISISVVMPSLNEEENVTAAIQRTLNAFEKFGISGEIIVVNDGSTDGTEDCISHFMKKDSRVKMIKHETPHGIGASFWDGVGQAEGESVVMLPGDNENDPDEIIRYHSLLDHVDIVIPFVFNKQNRPMFRSLLSFLYRTIINISFLIHVHYTNGTILYRKVILKDIKSRCDGFFFQTDLLVRLIKRGYFYAEVPYKLDSRKKGVSKAISFASLKRVMRDYLYLISNYYFFKSNRKNVGRFEEHSLTAQRSKGA
jgi:phenylacetate-CoA ligase